MSLLTPILTEADLIRCAQEAIGAKQLGIQRGAALPSFIDRDGSMCAIAAALPSFVREMILANGDERLNWLELNRAEYFTYASLTTIEALTFLQQGYDACFGNDGVDHETARQFCDDVMRLDPNNPPAIWSCECDNAGVLSE